MFNSGSNDHWAVLAAFALISLVGGALGYVMRTIDAGKKVRAGVAFLEGLSAAFFGVIMYAIYREFEISLWFAFGLAGLFAWAGSRATLKALKGLLASRTGIKLDSEDCKHENDSK
ncbi:hypothetical protein OMDBNIEC_00070 [Salmonella phage STP-SP5]|nr:hypothetical protein OMDBNIEC_00070 [Salmonella phage STP-SP5]